jgi:hypothetical protein
LNALHKNPEKNYWFDSESGFSELFCFVTIAIGISQRPRERDQLTVTARTLTGRTGTSATIRGGSVATERIIQVTKSRPNDVPKSIQSFGQIDL